MSCKQNLKQWKTTVAGIITMAASLAYVFFIENINIWAFGILLVFGIALLFLPNTFISSLRKLADSNSNKKF